MFRQRRMLSSLSWAADRRFQIWTSRAADLPESKLRVWPRFAPLAWIWIAECNKAPEGPFDTHTASFAALTGRALTIFRAGLALNIIGCPLKGFVPARALVAGFLITTNLANPGSKKTPAFFSSL